MAHSRRELPRRRAPGRPKLAACPLPEEGARRPRKRASLGEVRHYGQAGCVFGTLNASLRYWLIGTVRSFVANHFA